MASKLYVGNLPFTADDQSVGDLFAQCGSVTSCKVISDRETGRSKGFAFVEMSNETEAQAAIMKLNGQPFDGRPINVSEARPQAPRTGGGNRPRW